MTEPSDRPEQDDAQPEQTPPDAVLIQVHRDDDGRIATTPQVLGEVRRTEIETILGSALANWRASNRLPT